MILSTPNLKGNNMSFPEVSIIIPAKDEEKNISLCLNALKDTDYPQDKLEIIVIDNGSKDNTVRIAEKYDVKVIEFPDANISALRNKGANIASADIIIFIDADVIVKKNWLKNGITKFSDDAAICSVGGYVDIPSEGTWVEKVWHLRAEVCPDQAYTDWVSSMNMFVRKDIFMKAGGFNEKLITCEDVDLCFRMKKLGKILFVRNAEVIHLGEAKNLKHFFLKERWRGQSNLSGILSHGFHLKELPSIILPLFYLYFYTVFLLSLIFIRNTYIILFHIGMFISIPIARSVLLCLKLKQVKFFFHLTFLWWLYYSARAVAMLTKTQKRK